MSFTTLIFLPFVLIVVIFLGATIINIINHDHVFRPKYRSKHGKEASNDE